MFVRYMEITKDNQYCHIWMNHEVLSPYNES